MLFVILQWDLGMCTSFVRSISDTDRGGWVCAGLGLEAWYGLDEMKSNGHMGWAGVQYVSWSNPGVWG